MKMHSYEQETCHQACKVGTYMLVLSDHNVIMLVSLQVIHQ